MRAPILLLAATAAVLALPAAAQENLPPRQPSPPIDVNRETITVGAGVATIPSYEGADNNRIVPVAAGRGSISGFNFSTTGARLFVDVVRDSRDGDGMDFQLGPVVGFNAFRTNRKSINDRQVEALGELDTAIELGGYVGLAKTGIITSDYDVLAVNVSVARDVAGAHDSYTITPAVNYGTPLSTKAFVGIAASASYAGGGYNRYYFGVSQPGSLASGLPVFTPGSGWKNYSLSALGTHAITGDLLGGISVVGGISYSRLLNDAARSPIVSLAGDRDNWYGAIGLAYTF